MPEIKIRFKNISLVFDHRYPDKIWMWKDDGEGGQFDLQQLEETIEKFFDENM